MTDTPTCPRRHPDTGTRCGAPLPELDEAGRPYGTHRPCPPCRDDIAARQADALYWRCARVAQAMADGYILNDDGDEYVLPAVDGEDVGGSEVIAGDRAGAPSR